MRYPESSSYAFHNKSRVDWSEKDFEEWGQWRTELHAYWSWLSKRRFHALPEDKGIPVPHTGKWNRRKHANGSGVSASSRILSHRYADEGEKGTLIRREVRRKERAQWLSDWIDEGYDYEDAGNVSEWFGSRDLMWDWYEEDYGTYCDVCGGECVMN